MRLFNRFSVVPFHFILTVTLLFILPSGVFPLGGGKDEKAVQNLTAHIKLFGYYVIDLTETPPPLDIEYTFSV